jgi:FkbM family methyltransferase
MNIEQKIQENKQKIYDSLKSILVIGAMDGISHDRVFDFLANKTDYTAIFVEPVEYYFNELKKNAIEKLKGDLHFENVAISDKNEVLEMAAVKPECISKYQQWYDGCSCVKDGENYLNMFINQIENKEDLQIFKVQALTVHEILNKYNLNKLDYLQIDTEGFDRRIVNSIDFDLLDINVLRFELYYLGAGFYQEFSDRMKTRGYVTIIDHEDVFCIKETFLDECINN